MRRLALCALVALVGCSMEWPGITALDDYASEVAESGMVAAVACQPDTLDSASRETGTCIAQNAAGTRLSTEGTNVVIWSSSAPAVVSIDLTGMTVAESPGDVWIYAEGTHGSLDSVRVTAR